jgi:hypothetical protein
MGSRQFEITQKTQKGRKKRKKGEKPIFLLLAFLALLQGSSVRNLYFKNVFCSINSECHPSLP